MNNNNNNFVAVLLLFACFVGAAVGQDYYGQQDEDGEDEGPRYGPKGMAGVITADVPPYVRGFVDLDDWTYDAVVNSGNETRWVFVEVYAPWCGHCESLVDELRKVAEAFEYRLFSILLVKINGEENEELYQRFRVERYPTLFITKPYVEGEEELIIPFDPAVERTADSIIEFIFDNTNLLKRGRVAELDNHVREFMAVLMKAKTETPPWEKTVDVRLDQIIAAAEKQALGLKRNDKGEPVAVSGPIGSHHEGDEDTGRSAFEFSIIYTKYMRSLKEKGKPFIAAEFARLESLLDSDSVAQPKFEDLLTRINIMEAFEKLAPQPVLTKKVEL